MPFLPKVHTTIPTSLTHGDSVKSYCNMKHLLALVGLSGQRNAHRTAGSRPPWSCEGQGAAWLHLLCHAKWGAFLPLYCLIWNSSSFVWPPLRTRELSAAVGLVQGLKESIPWQSSSEQALPDFQSNCHFDTEIPKRGWGRQKKRNPLLKESKALMKQGAHSPMTEKDEVQQGNN